MKSVWSWLMNPPTDGPKSTLYLRVMAGGVFLWEGILKFVYANQGIGRFTKLGMPFPHFTADFVACLEIGGGLLMLSGLLTRLIAIPFVFEMIVAILSTKISLYLGTSPSAPAAGAAKDWNVGRAARGPLRIRAASHGCVPADQRSGQVVVGRVAWKTKQRNAQFRPWLHRAGRNPRRRRRWCSGSRGRTPGQGSGAGGRCS